MNTELPTHSSSRGFLTALIIVGVFACAIAALIRSSLLPPSSYQVGREFPPIEAPDWINGPVPSAGELRGKVLVVDAWAHWCGPCQVATPMLVHLYKKYKDEQIMFVGLTSEGLDEESVQKCRKFIKTERVPWPNGLGAVKTLEALDAEKIPQFWIVDRQNRIVAHIDGFNRSLMEDLERALVQALNTPVRDVKK